MIVFHIDPERCIGCGVCSDECLMCAIYPGEVYVIDPRRCVGCGECADVCPVCACLPGY